MTALASLSEELSERGWIWYETGLSNEAEMADAVLAKESRPGCSTYGGSIQGGLSVSELVHAAHGGRMAIGMPGLSWQGLLSRHSNR